MEYLTGPRSNSGDRFRSEKLGTSGEEREEGLELGLVRLELLRGHRVAHDALAGVEVTHVAPQERAPERDAELAVLRGVGPSERPRVPAPPQALERQDHVQSPHRRPRR